MDLSHASVASDATFRNLLDILTGLSDHRIRRRCWGDLQAFACLLALSTPCVRSSYESAIGWVYACSAQRFGWVHEPHPSGLVRSRTLLTLESCANMVQGVRSWAMANMPSIDPCIPGHVLVAVDGSMLHMPATPAMLKEFPRRTDRLGIEIEHYPQARLLMAWDAEHHLPLTWRLATFHEGEREATGHVLQQLPQNAVLVMDRGFPARNLLGTIIASSRHAIVRMVATEAAAFPEVRDFLNSGRSSAIVQLMVDINGVRTPITVKLVKRKFRRGRPSKHERRESMVILSTLVNIDDDRMIEIYGMRWGVETAFREMKSIASMERWHSQTPNGVRQELHALMCWFCMAGMIAVNAEMTDRATARISRKRVNTALAMRAVASILAALYAGYHPRTDATKAIDLARLADEALLRVVRHMQRRRPGRHNSRKPKHPYARKIA